MELDGTPHAPEEDLKMSVDLSIKRVPDYMAQRLRKLAADHHRSLQGELMAMLEAHDARSEGLTAAQLLALARTDGLSTPAESVAMIRQDRESR
jgi:plasmid stability protein